MLNRRRFLGSTMLSGAALIGLAGTAGAFSVQSCGSTASATACDEIHRHKQLLADLKRELDKRHLSPEQEQAVLATAVCPFCGALLLG
jgi:nitrous oxide reductase